MHILDNIFILQSAVLLSFIITISYNGIKTAWLPQENKPNKSNLMTHLYGDYISTLDDCFSNYRWHIMVNVVKFLQKLRQCGRIIMIHHPICGVKLLDVVIMSFYEICVCCGRCSSYSGIRTAWIKKDTFDLFD